MLVAFLHMHCVRIMFSMLIPHWSNVCVAGRVCTGAPEVGGLVLFSSFGHPPGILLQVFPSLPLFAKFARSLFRTFPLWSTMGIALAIHQVWVTS